jgi:hypothetical protein
MDACMRIVCRAQAGAKGWESDPQSAKQQQHIDILGAEDTQQLQIDRQRSFA